MTTGVQVVPGSDGEAMALYNALEWECVLAGQRLLWVPLNGGSDTRRAARECWEERAVALRLPFQAFGSHVVVGGPFRAGRGRRYVRNTIQGPTVIGWINWRKAKRQIRKHAVERISA